jgi:death-on-curing protein
MRFLTLEQLLEIHALAIETTGGAMQLRDLGRLEAAIATQTQNVFGEELYPTLPEKAAAMMRSIIADHPFVDGNKRTGILVGLTFLRINELAFKFSDGELEDFAVNIATQHFDVPIIASWISEHLV